MCFDIGGHMNLKAVHISDGVPQGSGPAMIQWLCLTWTCHSKVGHLFPKETHPQKRSRNSQKHLKTDWKRGQDRVKI